MDAEDINILDKLIIMAMENFRILNDLKDIAFLLAYCKPGIFRALLFFANGQPKFRDRVFFANEQKAVKTKICQNLKFRVSVNRSSSPARVLWCMLLFPVLVHALIPVSTRFWK